MSQNSNQNSNSQASGILVSEPQWNAITQAIAGLNSSQLTWVSGYLAGLAATGSPQTGVPINEPASSVPEASVTVLFGSQTGNAKGVAQGFNTLFESAGIKSTLVSMSDYKPRQLKNETHLVVVVSTHGEGDAPDDAAELHEFLGGKKAPKLDKLKYAVLGLGDTSYEFFCQTAKDFDERLSKQGATALLPREDCDVDYETPAAAWGEKLAELLKSECSPKASVENNSSASNASPVNTQAQTYTKKSPYSATLIESQKITGRDSVKDIRHIEISLEDSGIVYQPGDALGVWFKNDVALVDELIALTKTDEAAVVTVGDVSVSLKEALTSKLELTLGYPGFVKAYHQATQVESLATILADKAQLREYISQRQIIDVVREFPAAISEQDLANALRPLTPRLYSIASSQAEVEEEVHLTIAHVDYTAFDKRHQGGASSYLCERLEAGTEVDVFVESNDNFRLPEDSNTPVIMIGPGTGIAPFRAFMQERDAQDAEGQNWLFFGNPHFTQDFLYQTEWQGYVKSGLVSKISLAFSRDQAEKIYVQDRIVEQGEELFNWLESGAHVYVCGDANKMAKDVESALLSVIEQYGKLSNQDAKQYLLAMRKAKRYQKDVY